MSAKPSGLTIIAAAQILACSLPTLYGRIRSGSLPVLPLPGRKRVSVAGVETIIGRPLAIEEIESAERRAKEIRTVNLTAKHARAAQKEITP